ncbi:MAG: protein translocase subunit SecD [Wolbachia endosymbiont of Xenopsylla cheopis]
MSSALKIKAAFIFFISIVSLYLVLPNFIDSKLLILKNKMNLGLDLKGGAYLLLQADFDFYVKEKLDSIASEIKEVLTKKKIKYDKLDYDNQVLTLVLKEKSDYYNIVQEIKKISSNIELSHKDATLSLSYNQNSKNALYHDVMLESIANVQRRLDKMGTKEISVQRQGQDKILVQVPGINDTEQIRSMLGKTAKLTFHLLDNNVKKIEDINMVTTFLLNDEYGNSYPILRRIEISGNSLANATVGFDSIGKPVVNLKFDNIASKQFAKITKENVGKPFAIVLDNTVLTTPVIRESITGGQASISGNFTLDQANELAVLLKSGALPVPLRIVEEKSIGPSLGLESIKRGEIAALISVASVSLFIIISYGLLGILASIALFFNVVFILLILTLLKATLTLPGIAGIALTVGMAVDANILIFERIREEIKLGKKIIRSIEEGFKNAIKAILDSNITTLIAAGIMFMVGDGPIKGFAVTLSVGILSSMFSAITLTKLLIDLWVQFYKPKAFSI